MLSQLAHSILLGDMTQAGPIRTKQTNFRIFFFFFKLFGKQTLPFSLPGSWDDMNHTEDGVNPEEVEPKAGVLI